MPQETIDYASPAIASGRSKRFAGVPGIVIAALLLGICTIVAGYLSKSSSGRYQALQREGNTLVLIDTETGRMWEFSPQRGWLEFPAAPTGR